MDRGTAVAHRLRSLLERQRDALADYLRLIGAMALSLEAYDTARLEAQLEVERSLLAELEALRRTSDALEGAYRAAHRDGNASVEAARSAVRDRVGAVAALAPGRRQLIEARRSEVVESLELLRRLLPRQSSSPFSGSPRILDISG